MTNMLRPKELANLKEELRLTKKSRDYEESLLESRISDLETSLLDLKYNKLGKTKQRERDRKANGGC